MKHSKEKLVFYLLQIINYIIALNQTVSSKTNSACFFPLILVLLCRLLLPETKKPGRKLWIASAAFSVCFAMALVLGKTISETNHIYNFFHPYRNTLMNVFLIVSLSAVIQPVVCFAIQIVSKGGYFCNTNSRITREGIFPKSLILFLFVFTGSFLCYLAYYPGLLSYDIPRQTQQILGIKPFTAQHPPLHTCIWGLCITAGKFISVNPLLIYSLLQMLFISYVSIRIIGVVRTTANRKLEIASIIWLVLNPVICLFSIIPTKDVMFDGFLALFIIRLSSHPNGSLSSRLALTTDLILTCLLRNNAVYATILLIPLILLFTPKESKKELLGCILAGCFVVKLITGYGYPSMGIKTDIQSREALSVPIQQIGLTVFENGNKLTPKEKSDIDFFIPYEKIADSYNYRFADPLKNKLFKTNAYVTNKARFWKLWIRLFRMYPGCFLNAFLTLNLPLWYPDAQTPDPYSNRDYIETFQWGKIEIDKFDFTRRSKLPFLLDFYEHIADYSLFNRIPILRMLFSISTPIWVILFCIAASIGTGNHQHLPALVLPLLVWLTFLLGPVSICRYVFYAIHQYPLYIGIAAQKNR